ncbi:hypothetical protein PENSPDRAFT_490371 [Peniophora sp. CONT]|nr:hypothetical protein PENSPDRAFT_490371 [Peniophora sp. CONT]
MGIEGLERCVPQLKPSLVLCLYAPVCFIFMLSPDPLWDSQTGPTTTSRYLGLTGTFGSRRSRQQSIAIENSGSVFSQPLHNADRKALCDAYKGLSVLAWYAAFNDVRV